MTNCLNRSCSFLVLLALAAGVPGSGDACATEQKDPPQITPEQARQHIGEKVSVTFEVKATKDARMRNMVFLDSEENFMNEKNLGIALSENSVKELKELRNIPAPADYFLRRKIRVTGRIILREDRPYIDVTTASQIEEAEEDTSS